MHGHIEVYEAAPLPGNTWIHVGNPEMYSHLLLVCTRKKQCQQPPGGLANKHGYCLVFRLPSLLYLSVQGYLNSTRMLTGQGI